MSDDLISRQAAIDELKECRKIYCDNTPESFSLLGHSDKSRVDEIDNAIAILVDLPSAQKWIPVKMRPMDSEEREYQSADMVEVVRCKDCVHHKNAPKTTDVWCERIDGLLPKDWFCADGERREDE